MFAPLSTLVVFGVTLSVSVAVTGATKGANGFGTGSGGLTVELSALRGADRGLSAELRLAAAAISATGIRRMATESRQATSTRKQCGDETRDGFFTVTKLYRWITTNCLS